MHTLVDILVLPCGGEPTEVERLGHVDGVGPDEIHEGQAGHAVDVHAAELLRDGRWQGHGVLQRLGGQYQYPWATRKWTFNSNIYYDDV